MGMFQRIGLFNYSRPGPGINKGVPEKHAFFRFFELYFRKFFKLITCNLLYALVTLPVLTAGLGDVGLAYITRNYVREKHAFVPADFFGAIKKNWKQALFTGIFNLLVTALLIYDVLAYAESAILMVLTLFLLIVFIFMQFYIPLLIVTFNLTYKQLYKNALIFAFVGVLRNLLIAVIVIPFWIMAFVAVMVGDIPSMLLLLAVWLLIYPSFRAFLTQFAVFPLVQRYMIDPYYKDRPEQDTEKRKAVGLPVERAAEMPEEDQPVFKDMGRQELPKEEKETGMIPKQYSRREMERFERRQRSRDADEDGTI
ncbi:MAG: DUF624 domain-containing protein [Oscillospiraceae bacterium]|nr:DUF624 domain-containing protein [Oscillospiraceae bacterium]